MSARLLVAELSPVTRGWLGAALVELSPRITEAADGVELLYHLAEGGPFDLVIAQNTLPWLSAAHILAMARTAGLDTPFLLVAPVPTPRLRSLVRRARWAHLVEDPFDAPGLARAARALIAAPPTATGEPSDGASPRKQLPTLVRRLVELGFGPRLATLLLRSRKPA